LLPISWFNLSRGLKYLFVVMSSTTTTTNPTPRIFLTGVTGFVGGSILSSLHKAHPDIHITALVRSEADAKALQAAYLNFTPIIGTLSLLPLLRSAAAASDFVIHMAGENIPAVCAMIDGLASSSTTELPLPRLISLSGPRSLIDRSLPITGIATTSSRIWSDIDDAQTILSLPKERMHAEADQAIIAHGIAKGVGTILISPGQLWGRGKGLLKQESHAASYFEAVKKRARAFVIGDGSISWSWCSIGDLSNAVVFLMEQALLSGDEKRRQVGVNEEGYYFVQTDDVSLMERATAVSKRLGLGEVESVSIEVAAEIHQYGPLMWGCGARFRADRLTSLGWRPKEVDWRVLMEEEGGGRA
jgi:nucleoside-diphosphate-sugar epimerase